MPRTPGSSAAQTRARILSAALALFRERGFAGTSIRDLAERAQMTTAALYYHFEGKGQILDALVQPFLDDLSAFADTGRPGGDGHGPADDQKQLERLADVCDTHGPAIHAVLADLSAVRHLLESTDLPATLERVERVLAASDEPLDLLRARCAFGALKSGLFSAPGPVAGRGGCGQTVRAADGDAHRVVLHAALGALRSTLPPEPRPAQPRPAEPRPAEPRPAEPRPVEASEPRA